MYKTVHLHIQIAYLLVVFSWLSIYFPWLTLSTCSLATALANSSTTNEQQDPKLSSMTLEASGYAMPPWKEIVGNEAMKLRDWHTSRLFKNKFGLIHSHSLHKNLELLGFSVDSNDISPDRFAANLHGDLRLVELDVVWNGQPVGLSSYCGPPAPVNESRFDLPLSNPLHPKMS